MPAGSLTRDTKATFGEDLRRGWRRHRDQLATLFDDPLLGTLGLVDVTTLRQAALGACPSQPPWAALDAAMAAENWLRAHTHTPRRMLGGHRVGAIR